MPEYFIEALLSFPPSAVFAKPSEYTRPRVEARRPQGDCEKISIGYDFGFSTTLILMLVV